MGRFKVTAPGLEPEGLCPLFTFELTPTSLLLTRSWEQTSRIFRELPPHPLP